MLALLCIWGNKVFELEVLLQPRLQSYRLFHAPTLTTSSGYFVPHSEAIRDVEQTCKAKRAPLNYAGRAEKSDVYLNVVKFSATKKIATVNYTRLLLKVVTVYLSQ